MSRPPLHYRISAWFARTINRIGDVWRWLIGPFERTFGRAGEAAFGALDSFEGFESLIVRVVRFVFWPLIFLGRLLGRLVGPVNGPLAPLGRLSSWLLGGLMAVAERLNLDRVFLGIAWLLTPLWRPIAALLGFASAWLATRKPREVALATPAMVLLAPFAYVAVQGALLSQDTIAERYKIAVRDAVQDGDYTLVDLYERKLAQIGVDTRRSDYRNASKLADAGDLVEAYERMKRLAPADRPGYPSAHVWIVQRLLTTGLPAESEPGLVEDKAAQLALAEAHLDRLAELEVTGAGVSQLRAYVLANTGRLSEAAVELEPYAVNARSAANLRLQVLVEQRDMEAARVQARGVLELMAEPRRREMLTPNDYEAWSLAAEVLGDYRDMDAALTAWLAARPDDARPRQVLAKYRRQQAVAMLNDTTTAPNRAAEVFSEAVRLSGDQPWIVVLTGRLASRRASERYAQQVWDALVESDATPNLLLENIGTASAGQGEILYSREIFGRVVDAEDCRAVAWNNYAWVLIQDPDPAPDTALEAVNRALELQPGDHRFRETRGQVLIAMSRWDEAIGDLEYALNGLPESRDIHRSLATAYEALAEPQLAELHRRHADN